MSEISITIARPGNNVPGFNLIFEARKKFLGIVCFKINSHNIL